MAIGIGVGIALLGAGLLAIAAVELATGGDGTTTPVAEVGLIVLFWRDDLVGPPDRLAGAGRRDRSRAGSCAWNAARRTASRGRLAADCRSPSTRAPSASGGCCASPRRSRDG